MLFMHSMNSRSLPSVAGFFDTRAPVTPRGANSRLPNPVSIASMLNAQTPARSLKTSKHSFNPVSIASMLNAETLPPKPPRLVLTGMDIPECDIPELETGNLGEPAVKFTSVNKGPNHFPSHTEDLELLATSTRAYRFESEAIMETLSPPRSGMKLQWNSLENGFCLEPWVVPFIGRYWPARFSVGNGPSNNQQLSQRSGHEAGRGESSKLLGVWPFSGILKGRRFQVRNRRPRFGSNTFRGETVPEQVLESYSASGPTFDLHPIHTCPRLAVSPVSDFGSFWDAIPDTVLGGQCTPCPMADYNAPATRFPERSATLSLTLKDSEFDFTDPWEEPMSDC